LKVACIQPSYLPWKGYFHLIQQVDHFVFYDDAQYSKGSWRNRNQIIVNGSPKWLKVPVCKASWHFPINQVTIEAPYAQEHWRLIVEGYRKARHFPAYSEAVHEIVCRAERSLSNLTVFQTVELAKLLGVSTPWTLMSELHIESKRTEKLVAMCQRLGATEYISGPSARDYIEPEKFDAAGIKLSYHEYRYPEYPQLSREFTHHVSVLDMLFNLGPEAPDYIWGKHACLG
jgi:hypothetical protein